MPPTVGVLEGLTVPLGVGLTVPVPLGVGLAVPVPLGVGLAGALTVGVGVLLGAGVPVRATTGSANQPFLLDAVRGWLGLTPSGGCHGPGLARPVTPFGASW